MVYGLKQSLRPFAAILTADDLRKAVCEFMRNEPDFPICHFEGILIQEIDDLFEVSDFENYFNC